MTPNRRRLCATAAAVAGVILTASLLAAPATGQEAGSVAHPELWPAAASPAAITDPATEAKITDLMSKMSLEEKVGQTIQADVASITPQDLVRYPLGSLLAGGNSAPHGDNHAPTADWLAMIRSYRAVADAARPGHVPIPLIFGIDAVHGHGKFIGATVFPHNIGLGAMRDPDLIRKIGEATAQEVSATGADWTFAPTVAVPRDYHWGRSYEGYAEDPEVVRSYSGQMTLGLQGPLVAGQPLGAGHIAGSAKHFLGDGGTAGGVDQGDAKISEAELIRLHAQGYPPAIDAGILTVMASFSSWNGVKHTGNASLLTGVLKGKMGFNGFVVGDWNAHGQVPGCSVTDCPQAINAGLDMYMAPDSWKGLFDNTLAEVKSGKIPMSRLDDAVRRILRVKFKAGLFDRSASIEGQFGQLGDPAHRAIARQAVAESLVLLKNNGGVLPIRATAHILVAGSGADDIGKQSGGWTLNWQGTGNKNSDFPNGQSIYSGIAQAAKAGGGEAQLSVDGQFTQKPDVAIVVFGENPYAEFQGDIATLEYQPGDKHDLALLQRLKAQGIPVVSVFLSGRPLWTNPEINASDAFVAAWLPGTEGGGIADVLLRNPDGSVNHDFRGRLGFSWPKRADRTPGHREDPTYDPQFAYGYGLTYASSTTVPALSEDPGVRVAGANIDKYFVAGHAPAPWSLNATGAVSVKPIDAGAQENARLAQWSGAGPGVLSVTGPQTDLSRQTTGDLALMIRYRLHAAPSAPVTLSVACGDTCGAAVDLTHLLSAAADDQWHVSKIKLTCFRTGGADMSKVTEPFILSTQGTLSLAFTEIRLTTNEGDAVCPAAK